ncbi:hypothetical protein [Marisediminicola antarctica]|uniref:Uncharacterized protein n=1 Tax=Marisediminicola antarctica TaxID=674079 RepID=A0A7L5AN51_9MICO|nr:hypothetical protein [Marisediminicola antarctica]QHO70561.1 hypothetical protein BHD05_13780 [Marisediminicola antarctica]
MRHITFGRKSFLLGNEAADAVIKYAALLAQNHTADTVTLNAISSDGDEVQVTILLDTGGPIMSETTDSSQPEPENSIAVSYIEARTTQLTGFSVAVPDDGSSIADWHRDAADDELSEV